VLKKFQYLIMDSGLLNSATNPENYAEENSFDTSQQIDEGQEQEAEYEVESIIKKKRHNNVVYYLVKWKNFPLENCTWEPRENLENAPLELERFEQQSKQKSRSRTKEMKIGEGDAESIKKRGKTKAKGIEETNLFNNEDLMKNNSAHATHLENAGLLNQFQVPDSNKQQTIKAQKSKSIERGNATQGFENISKDFDPRKEMNQNDFMNLKVENTAEGQPQNYFSEHLSSNYDSGDENVSDFVDDLKVYGSLEYGDIPLKVVGVRPVTEENDLEVMMSWQVRPDGVKPEDSRVMRFDLIKKGHVMPLVEFYETKMKLERAPTFKSPLLSNNSS